MTPQKSTDLIDQLAAIRSQLEDERRTLLERVAQIDAAIGAPAASPVKGKSGSKPKAEKAGGIAQAIVGVLSGKPGLTIRELTEAIPEHPAKSVEATTRGMAADGRLAKDNETPRHFSLPSKAAK